LAGIVEVLHGDGARLIGGHTIEGTEFQVALSVQGRAADGTAIHKRGLRDGDMLILNKPLGTGTLFASAMRKRARMPWLLAAAETMRQSNRAMAESMRAHAVSAATDVSGFGLAGHLIEMLRASGVGARLDAKVIPILAGAADCIKQGIDSTLYPANEAAFVNEVEGFHSEKPAHRLTLDPQTGGGIVCGAAPDRADDFLAAVRSTYPEAAIIGRCMSGEPPRLILD